MKYKIYLSIGYSGANHEETIDVEEDLCINIDEWNELSEFDREGYLEDYVRDWSNSLIDTGWEKVE